MFTQAKKFLSNIWVQVGLIVAGLLALFSFRNKYDAALVSKKLTDLLVDDAKEQAKSEARAQRVKEIQDKRDAAKKQDRTPQEIEDYYNGKKSK